MGLVYYDSCSCCELNNALIVAQSLRHIPLGLQTCYHISCAFLNKAVVLVQRLNVPLNTLQVIQGTIFYRPDDQTNSVKALKETSWSSRSGLNPTRTTPPCYNNATLGNRLYAQRKGHIVSNPICWTCKNCSHKCAADCEHCVTQSSTEQTIFTLKLQTITITRCCLVEGRWTVISTQIEQQFYGSSGACWFTFCVCLPYQIQFVLQ